MNGQIPLFDDGCEALRVALTETRARLAEKETEVAELRARVDGYRQVIDRLTSRAASNGTDTSDRAAASIRPHLTAMRRVVLEEFSRRGGMTTDRLEQVLGRSHQSVSARVCELAALGWISTDGTTTLTRSGRAARVYRITSEGHRVLAEERNHQ